MTPTRAPHAACGGRALLPFVRGARSPTRRSSSHQGGGRRHRAKDGGFRGVRDSAGGGAVPGAEPLGHLPSLRVREGRADVMGSGGASEDGAPPLRAPV